jgi:hypothetical protein
VFVNNSGEAVNVFFDNGGTAPLYIPLPAGGRTDQAAAAIGEHVTYQVQGSKITTLEVFSVHRPSSNDCHTQLQATVTG